MNYRYIIFRKHIHLKDYDAVITTFFIKLHFLELVFPSIYFKIDLILQYRVNSGNEYNKVIAFRTIFYITSIKKRALFTKIFLENLRISRDFPNYPHHLILRCASLTFKILGNWFFVRTSDGI